jgi:hypothetical protein
MFKCRQRLFHDSNADLGFALSMKRPADPEMPDYRKELQSEFRRDGDHAIRLSMHFFDVVEQVVAP